MPTLMVDKAVRAAAVINFSINPAVHLNLALVELFTAMLVVTDIVPGQAAKHQAAAVVLVLLGATVALLLSAVQVV